MDIRTQATLKYMVQKPSKWRLWAASLLLAIALMLFGTGLNRVSADESTTYTSQVTGAMTSESIDPQAIGYSGDVSPPQLTAFSFAPVAIDTSETSATVTVTMSATDDMAGLCLSTCSDGSSMTQARFEHQESGQIRDAIFDLKAGTLNDGTFESEVVFPRGSAGGIWTIQSVLMADDIGNRVYLQSSDLIDLGSQINLANANEMASNVDTAGSEKGETAPTAAEPVLNKAYTRFEVHQVAKQDLIGTLNLKGEGFDASIPYSATGGEAFSVYALFPESIGPYELMLMANGHDDPILFVEGELERVRDGEYQHQRIGARADPDLLVLSPEEVGMKIALGSVHARLHSCIQLFSVMDAVFDLGVDTDGDGVIEPSESVTRQLNGESSACIETPKSNIPLTSHYESKVSTVEGKLIAKNKGLYDFVNKSSIHAEKESDAKAVREFKVQWIRTPMATTFEIKNSSLRPPPDLRTVMPKHEDKTEDILRNGDDVTPPAAGDLTSPPNDGGSASSINPGGSTGPSEPPVGPSSGNDAITHQTLMGFLMKNWMLLALGAGLLIAAYLVARGIASTSILSNQPK